METGNLFTWEALTAMGGASLLVFFVVQYTKTLVDRFAKGLPTDVYAVLVAWVILVCSQLALGSDGLDWRIYALSLANAFLVAAAAGQMQRKAIDPPGTSTTTASTESVTVTRTEGGNDVST